MGFNTVAFLLNDMMDSISKCPHQAAYILTHPPLSERDKKEDEQRLHATLVEIAKEHNEPMIHFQALEMMPTFHANYTAFFRAGQNSMDQLEVHKYGKLKNGKKTVTLILPFYDQEEELKK